MARAGAGSSPVDRGVGRVGIRAGTETESPSRPACAVSGPSRAFRLIGRNGRAGATSDGDANGAAALAASR